MSDSTKGTLRMNQTRRSALKLLAAATLLAPLAAQAQNPPTKSPPIHGLAHIAIRVNDIAASRAFYEKLGFQQAFDMEKNGTVTQSFIKVNDRQFIELYPKTEAQPTIGFLHLCFDGEDLNALHDFDVAQGLPATAVRKAGAGNLLFTLRGPEDQNIEYTQYMPGSLHYEDRGKHLSPDADRRQLLRRIPRLQGHPRRQHLLHGQTRLPHHRRQPQPAPNPRQPEPADHPPTPDHPRLPHLPRSTQPHQNGRRAQKARNPLHHQQKRSDRH